MVGACLCVHIHTEVDPDRALARASEVPSKAGLHSTAEPATESFRRSVARARAESKSQSSFVFAHMWTRPLSSHDDFYAVRLIRTMPSICGQE